MPDARLGLRLWHSLTYTSLTDYMKGDVVLESTQSSMACSVDERKARMSSESLICMFQTINIMCVRGSAMKAKSSYTSKTLRC